MRKRRMLHDTHFLAGMKAHTFPLPRLLNTAHLYAIYHCIVFAYNGVLISNGLKT